MTRTHIRTGLAILPLSVLSLTGLTACGDPCAGLSATPRDQQAMADGYDVERESPSGVECELQPGGTWQMDD